MHSKWKISSISTYAVRVLCNKVQLACTEGLSGVISTWSTHHTQQGCCSVFPLPAALCATCYSITGTNLTLPAKRLIHIFHLFNGKGLSVYFLSTTPGFFYVSPVMCACYPAPLCLYLSGLYHTHSSSSFSSPSFRMWVLSEVYYRVDRAEMEQLLWKKVKDCCSLKFWWSHSSRLASPPCCISAFPNDNSGVLPFYFPWNFGTDWVHMTFISCCVTPKWSNIFKLSTRPCKLSQQEVDLDKIICQLGVDPKDLAASSSMGLRWVSGTGQRVLGENKLAKDTELRIKAQDPKLWNFRNQINSDQLSFFFFSHAFVWVNTYCGSES